MRAISYDELESELLTRVPEFIPYYLAVGMGIGYPILMLSVFYDFIEKQFGSGLDVKSDLAQRIFKFIDLLALSANNDDNIWDSLGDSILGRAILESPFILQIFLNNLSDIAIEKIRYIQSFG